MLWVMMNRGDNLGLLPGFLVEEDSRPAREQINERYVSGWTPVAGASIHDGGRYMTFPGDPPFKARAVTVLRNEKIILFTHDFLAIVQQDGSFEVARVD